MPVLVIRVEFDGSLSMKCTQEIRDSYVERAPRDRACNAMVNKTLSMRGMSSSLSASEVNKSALGSDSDSDSDSERLTQRFPDKSPRIAELIPPL